ncbi:MAG: glycosyltransferase family 9 protein [Chlamydiales bacterium]|nr:glycosyltransferase family 9 protein [Chlamydiales bacterium]
MKYLVKRKSLLLLLTWIDRLTPKFHTSKEKKYNRILFCNTAHLGDVVNASYVIYAIKQQYPSAKIGFLLDKNAKDLISVDYVHTISHYKHNRNKQNIITKILLYWKSSIQALSEIKKIQYDIAIDLYLYFGNSAFFLFLANIPHRIGYVSGGFGNFFTERLTYVPNQGQIIQYYIPVLRLLNVEDPYLKSSIAVRPPAVSLPTKYIIIHPGCGNKIKEWPISYWKEVVQFCINQQIAVVLTGAGTRDVVLGKEICAFFDSVINLVNKLTLMEFSYVIKHAALVISVDSVASHLAGAFDVACIQMMIDPVSTMLWQAYGNKTIIIQKEADNFVYYKTKKPNDTHCNQYVFPDSVIESIKAFTL